MYNMLIYIITVDIMHLERGFGCAVKLLKRLKKSKLSCHNYTY